MIFAAAEKGISIVSSVLWVPVRQIQPRRMGEVIIIRSTDLERPAITFDELRNLVAVLPAGRLLTLLGAFAIGITQGPRNPEVRRHHQCDLAHALCEPATAHAICRLIQNGTHDVFLHPEQLLLLEKLAVLHSAEDDAGETIGPETLQRLLLGANDILSLDDDVLLARDDPGVAVTLRRIGAFPQQQDHYLIARYFHLFRHNLRPSQARAKPPKLDAEVFATALRVKTGIEMKEYRAFATLWYGAASEYYGVFTSNEEQAARAITFDHALRRHDPLIDPALLGRLGELFAAPGDLLARRFAGMEEPTLSSYIPFRERPIVRLANDGAVPLWLPFLLDKASIGVYWELHEQFRTIDRKEGVRSLTAYFGDLFQDYLTDLLLRIYPDGTTGPVQFYDEDAIIAGSPNRPKNQRPPFDALIVAGDTLVPIEMGVTTLTVATTENADTEAFRAEVGDPRKFRRKFRQLKRAVEGMAAGIWLADLPLQEIRHIYPVIALLHPFPQTEFTWRSVQQVIGNDWFNWPDWHHFGQPILTAEIHEPQIVTAEEWEMLEPLALAGDTTIPAILAQKLAHPEAWSRDMKTFLLRYSGHSERRNDHMMVLFNQAIEEARATLRRSASEQSAEAQ